MTYDYGPQQQYDELMRLLDKARDQAEKNKEAEPAACICNESDLEPAFFCFATDHPVDFAAARANAEEERARKAEINAAVDAIVDAWVNEE